MAIVVNVDVMLAKRKMSSTKLAAEVGITLNKLCKALDCQPGDILEYMADQEEKEEQHDI